MKTVAQPACRREIASRIAELTPSDRARWGSMSVHQMICHQTEAYRYVLGQKQVAMAGLPIPRSLLKFAGLRIPRRWPHGFPAPPELDQNRYGTPPVEFEQDRAALLAAFHEFCAGLPPQLPPHPYFGPMSPWDWQRWGYLHADHHLRQFGR